MKRLILVTLLFLTGCAPPGITQDLPLDTTMANNGAVTYYHDIPHKVSCWIIYSHGISCLPDSEVNNNGN